MSAFNGDTTQTINEETSFVEQLVGEGKKFATVEDLAKGKMEADRFIDELQATTKSENEALKSRMDELINKLAEQHKGSESSTGSENNGNTNTDTQNQNQSALDAESVEALVQKAMEAKTAETVRATNLAKVEDELAKTFGDRATEAVNAKARELNLSVARLQEMAEESPQAFMALVNPTNQTNKGSFSTTTNSQAIESNASHNTIPEQDRWSNIKKLRKENPNEYYRSMGRIADLVEKYGSEVFYKS